MAPAQRGSLIAQINAWAAQPGNTWIVGSRFAEYKGGQFASARFAEWELQPLDAERRHELARRLLPILRRLANDAPVGPSDPALPGPHRSPSAFVAALGAHPQAAAWGENPLLFSLAAVGYAQVGVLPVSRATLYREVIADVLATREPEAQQRDELRAVAAEVALRLHQTKGRTFSRAELESHVRAVRTEQEAGWTPDDMAHRIVGSGLLDVVAYETYTFRHQTFQEYLAAVALAARMTSDDEAVREAADEALAQILSLESGIEDD